MSENLKPIAVSWLYAMADGLSRVDATIFVNLSVLDNFPRYIKNDICIEP